MKAGSLFLACASLSLGACAIADDAATEGDELDTVEQPTVCGPADESQFVNDYDGTLGPTTAFVQTHKASKGGLTASASPTARAYCSGTLIGTNLFLTAGSCIGASMTGHQVVMNYERAAGSTAELPRSYFPVTAVLERDASVTQAAEWAIVAVSGSPGTTFGTAKLASRDVSTAGALAMMSQALGGPKKVEAGTVLSTYRDTVRYSNLDTLVESAGAALLDSAGRVAGVHTHGGCTATGGYNYGTRIAALRRASPIVGADCVFDWAERTYAALLTPAGAKNTYGFLGSTPFVYRYYTGSNAHLGLNLVDQHVYYRGPDGILVDQGTLASLRVTAACQ